MRKKLNPNTDTHVKTYRNLVHQILLSLSKDAALRAKDSADFMAKNKERNIIDVVKKEIQIRDDLIQNLLEEFNKINDATSADDLLSLKITWPALKKIVAYKVSFLIDHPDYTNLQASIPSDIKYQVKPNPIKSQKISSDEIRVFRTEDDKFIIVKKEKGCYGIYPEGNQFKRIGATNKKDAVDKAIRILSRKSNPRPDIKTQYHMAFEEIDPEVKEQIIKLYQEGDTLIRIARVCHINVELAKKVLAEAGVPVRKGGFKKEVKSNPRRASLSFASHVKDFAPKKIKRKSNPDFDANQFMAEVIKNIPQMWVKLRDHKFRSDEFDKKLQIIMWGQGVFLDWISNSYVTIIMINGLYDSFGVVEKDPVAFFKKAIDMTLFKRPEADKLIQKLPPKSYGAKAIDFFEKSKAKEAKLYFSFMEERIQEFTTTFSVMKNDMRLVDFTNFLREFSTTRYAEKHEVLERELTMKILKRPVEEELLSEEIDKVKGLVKDIHSKSMVVIARSKIFLQDYVKSGKVKKGQSNGKN